jgi:hypothetical protein
MHSRSKPVDDGMNPQLGKLVRSRVKSHPCAFAHSTSPEVGSTKHPNAEASTRIPESVPPLPPDPGRLETRFGVEQGGIVHALLA